MIWNDRIKNLRESNRMTLKEVATALGVTEATAQRYESANGIKQIPYEAIEKYSMLFDVSPSYIMGWDDEPRQAKAMSFDDLSLDERELVLEYRSLDSDAKDRISAHVQYEYSQSKKKGGRVFA